MVTNIEALKSSSIVSVIERYIPLRKNGANFIACCPFHSEKSPSFVVSEAKGMFKCFGCGKGGDALSFIKEYEKIDFSEAIKRLSELTGIALEYDKAQRVGKSPHEVLEKINELAKRELQKNAAIVEYLAQRGITAEICERYDIGLVPSKSQLLQHFSAGELVESGFANEYEKGKISIPMRERIGIAIRNPQHKLVAFVARTHPHYNFPPNAPKYINSKESYFYKKTQILYLYSNAKSHIQAQKAAFVVEGYIDSILLHENGFKNAIATGGTAFNVQHLNLLTKLDCEVIFCFDNDKSGMAANFRAVKVCFGAGFYKVKVAILQNRDTKGRLCKDINEALMDCHALQGKARNDREAPNLNETAKDSKVCDEKAGLRSGEQGDKTGASIDAVSHKLPALSRKTESTSEKLKFNYLSGYEFFIKWLYKNKDKQQAFTEIKAAISACKNFYDKQEFLDTACKLTGVPSEYFTQDKIPTKQPKDDYSKLVASILHSEECAYIASELDLSFLPAHLRGSLQVFIAQSLRASALRDKSASASSDSLRRTTSATQSPLSHSANFSSQILEAAGEQAQGVSQKAESFKEFIEVEPLDSDSFYQHYCDLYLAHLSREQTKARAKKDLKLVLALSEKIAQVQQDIQAQKAF